MDREERFSPNPILARERQVEVGRSATQRMIQLTRLSCCEELVGLTECDLTWAGYHEVRE